MELVGDFETEFVVVIVDDGTVIFVVSINMK
jgi:hypothetical protein